MMKRLAKMFLVMAALALLIPAGAMAADFKVGRFLVAADVQDREPVGTSDSFSRDTQKVYAYIEANDIPAATTVTVQWLYEGAETASIQLNIGQSGRWRTYSSKNLGGRVGEWQVKLMDAAGNEAASASFTVK